MEVRALTQPEQKYTYAQSMQLEGQTGCIGHLRGDFGSSGNGFYSTWFDTREQWKTDEFKAELDDVINALREDKGWKNRNTSEDKWRILWCASRSKCSRNTGDYSGAFVPYQQQNNKMAFQ